ncbi:hypothetical protein J6590_104747, partial [Homalodisca vitripennis]
MVDIKTLAEAAALYPRGHGLDFRAQKNDKDWTVQKSLLSARRASQMEEFDNEIERWGELDVPYLPS